MENSCIHLEKVEDREGKIENIMPLRARRLKDQTKKLQTTLVSFFHWLIALASGPPLGAGAHAA